MIDGCCYFYLRFKVTSVGSKAAGPSKACFLLLALAPKGRAETTTVSVYEQNSERANWVLIEACNRLVLSAKAKNSLGVAV